MCSPISIPVQESQIPIGPSVVDQHIAATLIQFVAFVRFQMSTHQFCDGVLNVGSIQQEVIYLICRHFRSYLAYAVSAKYDLRISGSSSRR